MSDHEETLTRIRNVIPMEILRAHDIPGTDAPTDQLDLVGAVRFMTTRGRELESEVRQLREALALAALYFGAPSDGNFDGLDDDAGVTVTTKVRIGDIKRIRALTEREKSS